MNWFENIFLGYTFSMVINLLTSNGALLISAASLGVSSVFSFTKKNSRKKLTVLILLIFLLLSFLRVTGFYNVISVENFIGEDNKVLYDINIGEGFTFIGQVSHGKANGKGRLFDKDNKLIFYGGFKSNLFHGKGLLYEKEYQKQKDKFDYVEKYNGDFADGLYSGEGKLRISDSELYEGSFLDGKKNGYGVETVKDYTYEGGFYKDKPYGFGTISYFDKDGDVLKKETGLFKGFYECDIGDLYENNVLQAKSEVLDDFTVTNDLYYENGELKYHGEMKNGLYNGFGKLYNEAGILIYSGNFLEGLYSGEGLLYDSAGTLKYEGVFKNGEFHGYGVLYKDRNLGKYVGNFTNGYLHGWAENYYFSNAGDYKTSEGEYLNSNFCGFGRQFYRTGELLYEGQIINGYRHNQGKLYYKNGNLMYEGNFSCDKFNNSGKYYYESGKIQFVGTFEAGKLDGACVEYDETGQVVFDGMYAAGAKHGFGKLYENGVLKYEGYYSNNEPSD